MQKPVEHCSSCTHESVAESVPGVGAHAAGKMPSARSSHDAAASESAHDMSPSGFHVTPDSLSLSTQPSDTRASHVAASPHIAPNRNSPHALALAHCAFACEAHAASAVTGGVVVGVEASGAGDVAGDPAPPSPGSVASTAELVTDPVQAAVASANTMAEDASAAIAGR